MEYTEGQGFAERDWKEPRPQKDASEYTKGEWEIWKPLDRTPPQGEGFWAVYVVDDKGNHIAKVSRPPDKETLANAHLITAAVNACIKLNPDNPMAVAESISGLYEALKEALEILSAVQSLLTSMKHKPKRRASYETMS